MTSNSHNSEFNSSFDNPYNKVTSAPNSPIKGAIVILLAILVSISGMLAAANSYGNADQHHSMGKTHRGPDFEAISAQLQLTEDQTEQLKTLLKSHHESRMKERQTQQRKRQGEHQVKRELHKKALDAELSDFLNEEQITDLHEILQKNRPSRPCNQPCAHRTASN